MDVFFALSMSHETWRRSRVRPSAWEALVLAKPQGTARLNSCLTQLERTLQVASQHLAWAACRGQRPSMAAAVWTVAMERNPWHVRDC